MSRNLKRTICTLTSTLLAVSFAYADIGSATPDLSISSLENRLVCLEQGFGINGITNPPGMPLTRNGWDFQISADALLWQLQEDGLTYAVETVYTGIPVGAHSVKQKYNWGFRIGLDWTLPHDNWDIAASWTHLVSNRHGTHTADPSDILIKTQGYVDTNRSRFTPQDALFDYTIGSSKYHNRLEQISLNLGREFFISRWVTLRPFFGLRADWLRQRLRTSYSGIAAAPSPSLSQITQQRNKWWGIGIESGLNTQLNFCSGFSLYGNVATAIEYGLQKLSLNESGIGVISFGRSYHICRPILDLQLGLGWDSYFCEDRFHLGLKLGWENHVYFDQSRFLFYNAVNYSDNTSGGSLTYQGWTLHASFDF
ncbi:MAG: Lpg1974 family pore-forming outer membrane protein [Candidatus Rhabdochlamydia sp.]